jgi:sortase A
VATEPAQVTAVGTQEHPDEVPGPDTEPVPVDPEILAPPDTKVRRRRRWSTAARIGSVALLAVGAVAIWFVVYSVLLTGLQEHSSQSRLYGRFRSELANETAPLGAPIGRGRPVALLDSRYGGLHRQVVVEGTTSRQMQAGPGHLPSTPLPGQLGDSQIFGRSLTFGAPFAGITKMTAGQTITVTTAEGTFTYQVKQVSYPGAPVLTVKPGQSWLTLVTSIDNSWAGRFGPARTAYVDALMVHGQAQSVPAALPRVGRSSLPMHNDPSALIPLAIWLGVLALAVVAVGWAWKGWGSRQTWLVGAPVLVFVSWGASEALMRFLPNLV